MRPHTPDFSTDHAMMMPPMRELTSADTVPAIKNFTGRLISRNMPRSEGTPDIKKRIRPYDNHLVIPSPGMPCATIRNTTA